VQPRPASSDDADLYPGPLRFANANAYSYSHSYGHVYAHTDSYGHLYTYTHSYIHAYAYADGNGHVYADRNGYFYSYTHSDADLPRHLQLHDHYRLISGRHHQPGHQLRRLLTLRPIPIPGQDL
jgi:hypothetical protein